MCYTEIMRARENIERLLGDLGLSHKLHYAQSGSEYIVVVDLNNLKMRFSDHAEAHFCDITIDPIAGDSLATAIKKIKALAANDDA